MSVEVVEGVGAELFSACVARWLVQNQTPPEFIANLTFDPIKVPEGGQQTPLHLLAITPPHTLTPSLHTP